MSVLVIIKIHNIYANRILNTNPISKVTNNNRWLKFASDYQYGVLHSIETHTIFLVVIII